MSEGTDLFLQYFGEIEKELDAILQNPSGKHQSFYFKVKDAQKKNSTIRRYREKLETFGDLRNFMSHNNQDNMVEPSKESLAQIKELHHKITRPLTAWEIAGKEVKMFKESDLLEKVLAMMVETQFTKFPVYRGNQFVGLLTENGIALWIAQHMHEKTISIAEIKVQDVLQKEESGKETVVFVSKDQTIDEINEYFSEPFMKVAFVTDNGKKEGEIKGIITAWDVFSSQLDVS